MTHIEETLVMNAFSAPNNSTKLELERRALLMQLGGYCYQGREVFYSSTGKRHLEAVTQRKARLAAVARRCDPGQAS